MTFKVNDRVTNGSVHGTVEAIFGNFLWVLVDGQSSPVTVPNDGSIVLETPIVFEVGKTYRFPNDTVLFHIVYKINDNNFVAWFEPPGGGLQVTLATPAQREQVIEV